MKCKNCGAEFEEGANFCDECGTKVEKETPVVTPEPVVTFESVPAALLEMKQTTPVVKQTSEQKEQKKFDYSKVPNLSSLIKVPDLKNISIPLFKKKSNAPKKEQSTLKKVLKIIGIVFLVCLAINIITISISFAAMGPSRA